MKCIRTDENTIEISAEKDNIIVINDNKLVMNIIMKLYFTKELNYKEKIPLIKRFSVLIVSRKKYFSNIMIEKTLETNEVIKHSNEYRKFLQDRNIFCNMNLKEFTPVYWGHYLNNYYNGQIPSQIPLLYIYPLALGREKFTIRSRGHRNALGKWDNVLPASFVISDVLNTADDFGHMFDNIFIDGTSIKKTIKINNLKCPTTVFLDSYFDERIPYLLNSQRNFLGVAVIPNLENVVIKFIKTSFENELEEAFILLKDLKKESMPNFELKVSNKILYNIVRTCIEGLEYDFIAKAITHSDLIRDLIKELKDSDYKYVNKKFENLIILMEDIYNKHKLDNVCPKYNEVILLVERAKRNGKRILIVVSSKVDSIGLKDKLSQYFDLDIYSLEEHGIIVATYYDVLRMQPRKYEEIIITSAISFKDLEILTKNLGEKIFVLLYQIEIRELKTKLYTLSEIKINLDIHRVIIVD